MLFHHRRLLCPHPRPPKLVSTPPSASATRVIGGINKITNGRTYPDRLLGVAAIPGMIEQAHYLGAEPDQLGRNNVKAIHRYEVDVQIGQRARRAEFVVREAPDGHYYYDHHFFEKEEPVGNSGEGLEGRSGRASTGSAESTIDNTPGQVKPDAALKRTAEEVKRDNADRPLAQYAPVVHREAGPGWTQEMLAAK
jgi:hypothetical protein